MGSKRFETKIITTVDVFHFKFYFGVIMTAPAENNRDYLQLKKIPEVRVK